MAMECGAKWCIQLGVRSERQSVIENVEKTSMKASAVLCLAEEELSVVLIDMII